LKKFLLILSVLIYFALAANTAKAQIYQPELPMACIGDEVYKVEHTLDNTIIIWEFLDPNGNSVSPSKYVVNYDEIKVKWDDTMLGGPYTFKVTENSPYGCTNYHEAVVIYNTPTINIPFDFVDDLFAVCRGDRKALYPGEFLSYLWSVEDGPLTTSTYLTGNAGTYQVQLVDRFGDNDRTCTYNNISLAVVERPEVRLGNDTVLFGTQQLELPAFVSSTVNSFEWNTGSIASTFTVDGTMGTQNIILTVYHTVDDLTCSNSDTIKVSSANYSNLRIPAAFTPNGDGRNDYWVFPAPQADNNFEDYNLYEYLNDVDVQVFNRWGKMVWSSTGAFNPWDGKDLSGRQLPMDSYHYIIRINVDDKSFVYKGSVTIIR
jgi:gliding motility-associated-like protein